MAQSATGGLNGTPIKARVVKVKSFTDATAAGLDTAVNAWLAAAGEKTLVDITSAGDSTLFMVTLYYTEG